MPTGYTQDLCSKQISFEEYIMTCTRAFGVCVSLRDERLSSEVPLFEPSSYYKDSYKNAEKELEEFEAIEDKEAWYQGKYFEEQKCALEEFRKAMAVLDHLAKTEGELIAWECPEEYYSVKEFAQEQLMSTTNEFIRKVEYYKKALKRIEGAFNEPVETMILEWTEERDMLKDRLKSHVESYAKEVERCKENNEWFAKLKASLQT